MKNWIVVTGDSSGLGAVIVKRLLDNDKCVIGISRKESGEVKERLRKFHSKFRHINWDLSDIDNIKNLYASEIKPIGPIGGLVNNAATAYDDLITNAKPDALEQMTRLNLLAPIVLTKYALRDMLLNGIKGSIVHVSSICAHTGYTGLSMYGATKGGLEGFSRGVAREWGKKGIRSNCVAPGFMKTKMSSKLSNEQRSQICRRTSLRKATEIDSVAAIVEFLLSSKSSSITGQTIIVDAGSL